MAKRNRQRPKQIVYLFGAGATQAEVDYLGARRVNLLMRDNEHLGEGVSTRVLKKIGRPGKQFSGEDQSIDIEKLISLLIASGVEKHSKIAEAMRRQYFEEVCASLVSAGIVEKPGLVVSLLEMHKHHQFQEEVEVLSGIITTNHDGLLQIASQNVFGEINLGFPFSSDEFTPATSPTVPPILQLHGSFTWTFDVPVKVTKLQPTSSYAGETIWIPPAILKESKNYPFNKLIGLGYELLAKRCDVLRVVGASLTQNDWNVLSLIFNAQRHRELRRGAAFLIELIMPHAGGKEVERECSYLKNIIPIGNLTEGQFTEYKEMEHELPAESEMRNPFAYWLKEKINYHRQRKEFGDGPFDGSMAQIAGEAI